MCAFHTSASCGYGKHTYVNMLSCVCVVLVAFMSNIAIVKTMEENTGPLEPIIADREEQRQMADVARFIEEAGPGARFVTASGETCDLPAKLRRMLEIAASRLALGDSLSLVPVEAELTTQQAADLLNVSRQYLVRLADGGAIPHFRTGKHRRLRLADVLLYKKQRDSKRRADLRTLTQLSEEFGGYNELD